MGKVWELVERWLEQWPPELRPSERQLATFFHVSPTTIGNWRSGRTIPSRKSLGPIQELTHVSAHALNAAWLEDQLGVQPTNSPDRPGKSA